MRRFAKNRPREGKIAKPVDVPHKQPHKKGNNKNVISNRRASSAAIKNSTVRDSKMLNKSKVCTRTRRVCPNGSEIKPEIRRHPYSAAVQRQSPRLYFFPSLPLPFRNTRNVAKQYLCQKKLPVFKRRKL